MLDFLKNKTIYRNKYRTHSEAVIISCYFNPQNSPYRLKAFQTWYESIQHLNHRIIECIIGDAKPQLPENKNIQRIYTPNLLWHKESLLNKIVAALPKAFKYVFWIDADVLFTNNDWLVDSVKVLQTKMIMQPFEYCVHLEQDELKPSINLYEHKQKVQSSNYVNDRRVWRSFCANFNSIPKKESETYHLHGHVGFAWGARRELLEKVPLYDKALIGGADHIIAHAAVGETKHKCIVNAFSDNIDEITDWSDKFFKVAKGKIGYVEGDLYHIWHGDINKREYLKRIQDFTPETKHINQKDKNGLYITHKQDHQYIKNYFQHREVCHHDDGFLQSMAIGYLTDSPLLGGVLGGNFTGGIIGHMLHPHSTHNTNTAPSIYPESTQSYETPVVVEELAPMPREVIAPDNFS